MSWLINANALQNPLADKSVHMCVTSPPYWGLRSYSGTTFWVGGDPECDHAVREDPHLESSTLQGGKMTVGHQQEGYKDYCRRCGAIRVDNQLGLEQTPEAYVENMVAVFREVWRVLRDDGTLWLNLGDSYWGGKGQSAQAWSTEHQDRDTLEKSQHQITGMGQTRPQDGKHDTLKPKDLVGIPWRVAFALQADGWYLRSDIIWSKPNPMPESVTDRPTKAHEYLFLLSKQPRYYYDADAVREEYAEASLPRALRGISPDNKWADGAPGSTAHTMSQGRPNQRKEFEAEHGGGGSGFKGHSGYVDANGRLLVNPNGRNRRTVWTIATAPYSGSHFATYPPALVEPCIKAGTSERGVCPKCGKPWERMTNTPKPPIEVFTNTKKPQDGFVSVNVTGKGQGQKYQNWRNENPTTTLGWQPACTCDAGDPVSAVVLDPFAGSGTTLLVARQLGRRGVGLDLSYSYLHEQARKRLGLDALDAWINGIAANDNGYHDLPMFSEIEP